MKLRQIRSLVVLASELHYRRAAARLEISQSALSQQIRALESDIGVRLVDRNRRSVKLTEAGELMVREARVVLETLDDLIADVRRVDTADGGELAVAVTRSAGTGLATEIVERTRQRHGGLRITVSTGYTGINLGRLRAREIDLGFVRPPVDLGDDLEMLELGDEPIVIAIPAEHPLAEARRVDREAIRGLPTITFPRRDGPGHFDRLMGGCFGTHEPNIVRIEPEEESLLFAVASGYGIGLLTLRRAQTLRIPGVAIRRFSPPEPTAGLAVCWHRRSPSPAVQYFLDAAHDLVSNGNGTLAVKE